MKGMELPISIIVVIIIGLIVIVALYGFLTSGTDSSDKSLNLMQKHTDLCSIYTKARCVENDVSPKYASSFRSDMITVCNSLGYISDSSCTDFDKDCGKPCCKNQCTFF